jgi:hypothetical protein
MITMTTTMTLIRTCDYDICSEKYPKPPVMTSAEYYFVKSPFIENKRRRQW